MKCTISCHNSPAEVHNNSFFHFGAIKPEFVIVRYIDPQDGSVTRTIYSNNIPTICATVNPDGTAVWKGLTFPLIER